MNFLAPDTFTQLLQRVAVEAQRSMTQPDTLIPPTFGQATPTSHKLRDVTPTFQPVDFSDVKEDTSSLSEDASERKVTKEPGAIEHLKKRSNLEEKILKLRLQKESSSDEFSSAQVSGRMEEPRKGVDQMIAEYLEQTSQAQETQRQSTKGAWPQKRSGMIIEPGELVYWPMPEEVTERQLAPPTFLEEVKASIKKKRVPKAKREKQAVDCAECGRKFPTPFQLREHISISHLKERKFECEDCGQKFGRRGGLRRHVKMVHLNLLHKCPYEDCDHPGYKCSKALQAHIMSVHTNIRPFACEECEKTFVRRNDLRMHSLTHNYSIQFKCKCGQQFRRQVYLKRHQRSCRKSRKGKNSTALSSTKVSSESSESSTMSEEAHGMVEEKGADEELETDSMEEDTDKQTKRKK